MGLVIGDLVESAGVFEGIGKVAGLDEVAGTVTVSFFESPLNPHARPRRVDLRSVQPTMLFEDAPVFTLDQGTGEWSYGRYGCLRPSRRHLVVYSRERQAELSISDLYVLNLAPDGELDPIQYLAARCCDTPRFTAARVPFVTSFVEQRAACHSMSSLLSSAIDIEPHQIAVVRRILNDETKKYLLADEVGLGKTIEAALVIREHVLQDDRNARVLVSVPDSLVAQWKAELADRFYLGELIDERVFVCSHTRLPGALRIEDGFSMVVIDEAHHVAPWAWADDPSQRADYAALTEVAQRAEVCLLLSGTPLTGNERNFLAMLHLLSPANHELSDLGLQAFGRKVAERERLGGMYQALLPTNDNESIGDILDGVEALFPRDDELRAHVTRLRPLVDWLAPSTGAARDEAIARLRRYLGERYRLFHRMLRNRRDDPVIGSQFPGLAGLTCHRWAVASTALSVDQLIDEFRVRGVLRREEIVDWLALYFESPMLVAERAERDRSQSPHGDAEAAFDELIQCSQHEQAAKDATLLTVVHALLERSTRLKAVVFCGKESLADHVTELLRPSFGGAVERHRPAQTPGFTTNPTVRVLVCDARGEDGLNLHGGEKVAIHYGLPLDVSRYEQRNGRVNRYSAGIRATPVSSIVLAPDRDAGLVQWIRVLDDGIQIFNRSAASLQFVLQQAIDLALGQMPGDGVDALTALLTSLQGRDGLLARERARVSAQEQLASMEADVEAARAFAEDLQAADECAQDRCTSMFEWIERVLLFQKTAEAGGGFRYCYSRGSRGPRTLVDIGTFLERCLVGIDRAASDADHVLTAPMSHRRSAAAQGRRVYPMRYGHPFVDVLFELMTRDARGMSSAWLRLVGSPAVTGLEGYLQFVWRVDLCAHDASPLQRRLADRRVPPQILRTFTDLYGSRVTDPARLSILDAPYAPDGGVIGTRLHYKDHRIRAPQWASVDSQLALTDWAALVADAARRTRHELATAHASALGVDAADLRFHPEAASFVALLSPSR